MTTSDSVWVPEACTLPTVERPVRLAEFDDLLAQALRGQRRLSPTRLQWRLDPAAEPTTRDLASRESQCCAFFTFTFHPAAEELRLDIEVPRAQVHILDALAARAASRLSP